MLNHSLGADAEVDDDFWDEVLKFLLPRMNDKIPVVRKHAVSAVSRLQDPTDVNDAVVSEYIRLLGNDSSKEVRKAVLANIGVTAVTLPHIIKRTRDIREDVRKYAYTAIAIKVDVKKLQIAQRVQLVEQGLQDRCEAVQKACSDMVCKFWMSKCDDNPLNLLRLFDVEIHTTVAERAIKSILAGGALKDPASFVPLDKSALSSEQVLYWRVIIEHAISTNNDELLETVLPEILLFCDVFRANATRSFLASQLLQLCLNLDFGDEVGRRQLHGMATALLLDLSTPQDLVPHLVAAVHGMEAAAEDFVAYIVELLNRLKETEEVEGASQLRGLSICREVLRTFTMVSQIGVLTAEVKAMVECGVQSEDAGLRLVAVQSLGLFCLLDEVKPPSCFH
jgi:condensin complex subunit 3